MAAGKIVLASGNAGKLREINAMLAGSQLQVVSQAGFQVPAVAETGTTFVENAIIKARHAAAHTGLPAIADDSGIEIPALNGVPGIYSSRYAGENATDRANLEKLIAAVSSLPEDQRQARFVCLMVYLRHAGDAVPVMAEGIWNGVAVTEPRGENGFGYDPMFYLPESGCTSAELAPEIKNQISHRSQALRKLVEMLNRVY